MKEKYFDDRIEEYGAKFHVTKNNEKVMKINFVKQGIDQTYMVKLFADGSGTVFAMEEKEDVK